MASVLFSWDGLPSPSGRRLHPVTEKTGWEARPTQSRQNLNKKFQRRQNSSRPLGEVLAHFRRLRAAPSGHRPHKDVWPLPPAERIRQPCRTLTMLRCLDFYRDSVCRPLERLVDTPPRRLAPAEHVRMVVSRLPGSGGHFHLGRHVARPWSALDFRRRHDRRHGADGGLGFQAGGLLKCQPRPAVLRQAGGMSS